MYKNEIETKSDRLTEDFIDKVIVYKDYHHFLGACLTTCCLTLRNGYSVTGEAILEGDSTLDIEVSKHSAYSNARDKVWVLESYLLKQRQYCINYINQRVEELNNMLNYKDTI